MRRFAVIYERGPTSWGAYLPDLPGCISIGATLEETKTSIAEAAQLYIECLNEKGEPIPEPVHVAGTVTVD